MWLRLVSAGGAALVLLILVAAVGGTYLASTSAACKSETEVTGTVKGVPKEYVPFYLGAAEKYKLGSRGPAILAGIHRVETNFGTLDAPGVTSGVNSYGCCSGHMQFYTAPFDPILPAKGSGSTNSSTWGQYGVDADGDGKKNPFDAEDAIYSSANYLRASGAPGNWHDAIFAYNHAEWYIADVLDYAEKFGGFEDVETATTAECKEPVAGGPANLNKATRLTEPREFARIPTKYTAGQVELIDARILNNVIYLAKEYDLTITQGRGGVETGSPSVSHGYGTQIDAVPEGGKSWEATVDEAAADLGWERSCGSSGMRPACKLVPAICCVYYDGYPNHGRGNHIHIGWVSSAGPSDGHIHPPTSWTLAFDSPSYGGG